MSWPTFSSTVMSASTESTKLTISGSAARNSADRSTPVARAELSSIALSAKLGVARVVGRDAGVGAAPAGAQPAVGLARAIDAMAAIQRRRTLEAC